MSYPQFGYTYPPSSQLEGASYDSRLLSFPRLAASSFGHLYSYDSFYAHTLPYDLKESRSGGWALQQSSACYPYDPNGLAPSTSPYTDRFGGSMESAQRRKNASRETTTTLKAWLYEHRKNPYPTKGEKIMLAIITKMTLTQVSTWFANARRRLKKENKMTWEPRNKTSEGDEDRDSSSPPPDTSDNITEFLKQQQQDETTKHGFSFEPGPHPSSPKSPIAKDSSPFDCCRPPHCSEEDSGGSESPSRGYFEKGGAIPPPPSFSRPKIWSLARTATSDSPPPPATTRRDFCTEDYPAKMNNCSSMYCGEGRKLDPMFCLESKMTTSSSCSEDIKQPFCDSSKQTQFYADESRADIKQATLFCDGQLREDVKVPFGEGTRIDFGEVSPKSDCFREFAPRTSPYIPDSGGTRTKDLPCRFTKCEAADSVRGSCMMPYATEFPSGVGDIYPRTLDYAPGGTRSEYFVPDRFDHAILIHKGAQDVEESQ